MNKPKKGNGQRTPKSFISSKTSQSQTDINSYSEIEAQAISFLSEGKLEKKDSSTPPQELKALQDASKTPKDTLNIQPQRASTLNELGLYHSSQKNFESAASYFKKAIEINKTCCDPYINYGNLLSQQNRYDDALELYLKALEIDESNGLCLHNIGSTLQAIGALEEALQFYRYALENNYQSSDLMYNLGMLFRDLNKPHESAEAFKEAHLIDPDNNTILSQYITMKKITASWEEMPIRRRFKAQYISEKHGAFDPFFYAGHHDDPELQHLNAAMHASTVNSDKSNSPESFNPQKATKQKIKPAKLKIGYFSSNFNNHPVLHLIKGVLSKHDTSKFDVYLFDICSSEKEEDPYLKEIKNLDLTYLYIGNLPVEEALSIARSFDLNIAIDLMGYTEDNKIELFANRIAPVQINYLGYPGTTGSDTINDYIIADSIVIPKQHEKYYSEQVIRLPDCYQCNDDKRKIDDSSTLGPKDPLLDQAKFVFCCFNNTWKITSKEFDIWMRLLKKVQSSVLWLLADNNIVIENLKKEAKARGIESARIIFAERVSLGKHLARHQWADLFLDTFTYNAHTTASDALWAGLPVLTLKGNSFPSRVGASILTAAGLTELITSSEDDYEAKALRLAEHPDELMEIRNQLSDNRLQCSLFNTTETTHNLERIYQNCWENLINSAPK